MKTPHKHAELIKAWADGATIQCKDAQSNWCNVAFNDPSWNTHYEYRIKPEPKPDVVIEYTIELSQQTDVQGKNLNFWVNRINDNVRFTFDGETGALKAAEVLK